MPKGNEPRGAELRNRLEEARKLLDEAIALVGTDNNNVRRNQPAAPKKAVPNKVALDFSMSIRAFIKANTKSMSGPKKLVMLIAYLAKGQETARVPVAEITGAWTRM